MSTLLNVKGTLTKTFFFMLGMALVILAVGMAWSLVVRGFASVTFNKAKAPMNSLHSAASAYSDELPPPVKAAINEELIKK